MRMFLKDTLVILTCRNSSGPRSSPSNFEGEAMSLCTRNMFTLSTQDTFVNLEGQLCVHFSSGFLYIS